MQNKKVDCNLSINITWPVRLIKEKELSKLVNSNEDTSKLKIFSRFYKEIIAKTC